MKRNLFKFRKSNKIELKESKELIVDEILRKKNKLNFFLCLGVDKFDNNDKIKGEKIYNLDLNDLESSYDFDNSFESDGRKKVSNKKLLDKNKKRKSFKKD